MKTNLSQLERTSSNASPNTQNSTLQDNLRSLRLTYLLENAVQAAEQAAGTAAVTSSTFRNSSPVKSPCAMTAASSAASMTPASRSLKPWPDGIGTGPPRSTACKSNTFCSWTSSTPAPTLSLPARQEPEKATWPSRWAMQPACAAIAFSLPPPLTWSTGLAPQNPVANSPESSSITRAQGFC